MFFKEKFSFEEKLKAVQNYLEVEKFYRNIGKQIGTDFHLFPYYSILGVVLFFIIKSIPIFRKKVSED